MFLKRDSFAYLMLLLAEFPYLPALSYLTTPLSSLRLPPTNTFVLRLSSLLQSSYMQ